MQRMQLEAQIQMESNQQSDVQLNARRDDQSPNDDEIDPDFREAVKNLGLNDDQIREYQKQIYAEREDDEEDDGEMYDDQ